MTDVYGHLWSTDETRAQTFREVIREQVKMTRELVPKDKPPLFHFTMYSEMLPAYQRNPEAFDLPEGTIYPVLHRLEAGGLLAGRWVTAESGRRRRVYTLTRRGERALAERRAVWQQFSDAIGSLLAGARPAAPAKPARAPA